MLLPAVIGVVIIVARPNVATSLTRLRGTWLIAIAAVLQFVHVEGWWPEQVPGAVERRVYAVLVIAVALTFSWLNRSLWTRGTGRWALSLIPLGTMSNAIPIAVLGAMPYSLPGARIAGYTDAALATDAPGYVRLGAVSPLWTPIADVIPVPVLMKVLSLGDLFLLTGLVLLIVACCLSKPEDEPDAATPSGGAIQPSV
ncbi:hypothetical protein GCM10010197_08360 [Nocardioides luteus]|uniref:Uncharacterized protein n=2 Tax=Nocardioides luteus TaxID=1844 RepID=A0ABQ5SQ25_9ACTN|nr:hypothetical protein GCM10010197_08360 [Nocardioides luteus]GLJ66024.1 hypothetical protein GCM10017579_00600 [Nocardioides luteus]